MKKIQSIVTAVILSISAVLPVLTISIAQASSILGESFNGVSTTANAWISGGAGGSVACLTAGSSSTPGTSIPACSPTAIDSAGSGTLRLNPNTTGKSGFAIYNTPISTSQGLNINFDMYQYGGNGADGISFFLIDGSASPTQPGASGGALGYASSSPTAGLVGGYVGIGFDRYGNFSSSAVGNGGPGQVANSIAVRGSAGTGYPYITGAAASGALENTTRINSKLPVRIYISSADVMTVQVNYGSGYVTELANIDLKTVNGAGSLPATFKMGFAASTGGSYDMHEISDLTVATNPPNVSLAVSHSGSFVQGSTTGSFTLTASNAPSAEPTTDTITVTDTLPTGLTPTSATGTGWNCNIVGQAVTCTRPGDGANALAAGASAPAITLGVSVADNATVGSMLTTASVNTTNNANGNTSTNNSVTIVSGNLGDTDGVPDAVEAAAPNGGDGNGDGIPDNTQATVTSLVDPVTTQYATLASSGCTANNSVSIANQGGIGVSDGSYSYPAGLMNFTLTCTPGATATVSMYYYGLTTSSNLVLRKYNATTQTYMTVPGAVFTSVTIGGQQATKVTYQITDGGSLDADGLANGTIVDPAGPALAPVSTPPGSTNTGLADTGINVAVISGIALLFMSSAIVVRRSHNKAIVLVHHDR